MDKKKKNTPKKALGKMGTMLKPAIQGTTKKKVKNKKKK